MPSTGAKCEGVTYRAVGRGKISIDHPAHCNCHITGGKDSMFFQSRVDRIRPSVLPSCFTERSTYSRRGSSEGCNVKGDLSYGQPHDVVDIAWAVLHKPFSLFLGGEVGRKPHELALGRGDWDGLTKIRFSRECGRILTFT